MKSEKGCPTKGVPAKGMSGRRTLVEVKFLEEKLNHQRSLQPVSHESQAQVQAQAQMQWDRVWIQWGCPHPFKQ